MPPDEENRDQDQGGQTPQGDPDAPKYVTEAQLNKAISARFASFEKKLGSQAETDRKAVISEVGSLLDEKLGALKPADDGKPDPKGPDAGKADDPRIRGLEKQVAKLTTQLEQERQARDAETRKAADVSLRGKLAEALAGHGIEGKRAVHALGHLVDATGRAHYGDDGESIVFRDEDGQDVDLKTGLADWAKSEDAKLYLAPSGAHGSGSTPRGKGGGGSAPGSSGQDKIDEIGEALQRELLS